jgi:hypothetical protein
MVITSTVLEELQGILTGQCLVMIIYMVIQHVSVCTTPQFHLTLKVYLDT